jgi:anti-sigma factor RsiW
MTMSIQDHIEDLIPWFVNDTLDAREQQRVTAHLEQCARCRAELSRQRRIRSAILQPGKVELAPQASFNKLWERISTDGQAPATSSATRQRAGMALDWCRRRWMPIALAAQLLIIASLGVVIAARTHSTDSDGTGPYQTVTSDNHADQAIIHVVFADDTRLSDVKDILARTGVEVVSGPSAAGVYTLTPDARDAKADLQAMVTTLRNDPRVRFAEVSHP